MVNNAVIAVNAPVEVFAIDEWRRPFEVNLFGHIAVTQTLLIRSEGRVVKISSVGGKIAMATYGPYAGTKFAPKRSVAPCDAKSPRSASRWSWSNRAPCVRKWPAGRLRLPMSWRRP
jgi:NADP-dependent 3-hydroxy acid dehydrogenase YdfG